MRPFTIFKRFNYRGIFKYAKYFWNSSWINMPEFLPNWSRDGIWGSITKRIMIVFIKKCLNWCIICCRKKQGCKILEKYYWNLENTSTGGGIGFDLSHFVACTSRLSRSRILEFGIPAIFPGFWDLFFIPFFEKSDFLLSFGHKNFMIKLIFSFVRSKIFVFFS